MKLPGWNQEETEYRILPRIFTLALIISLLVIAFTCAVVFAAEKPAWLPALTQPADWYACLYILVLVILGGVIGISKFLREGRRG